MSSMNGAPVLVLGGTGHYGSMVVKELRHLGARPRVLSRNIQVARERLGDDVEMIEGDLLNPDALRRALEGCQSLGVCVSAFTRKLIRRLREIEVEGIVQAFREAEDAGVERVVYLSVYQPDHPVADEVGMIVGPMKKEVEDALASMNLDWTVLGAPPSMEIFFAFIRGNKMVVPGGGPPAFPSVASKDVGTIMAQALIRDDLGGQRFRLPGPEALSFPEAARRIGEVWGRPIEFMKVPLLLPRIGSLVVGPFVPYVKHIVASLRLLNAFPAEIADQIPADHRRLLETFDYTPRTLEDEARDRREQSRN